MSDYYLAPGLAQPAATELDAPYWNGLRDNVLNVQRCNDCGGWQWGPEWICHHCHSDDVHFVEVELGVVLAQEPHRNAVLAPGEVPEAVALADDVHAGLRPLLLGRGLFGRLL